ncbi:hypothetical protein PILCRDRAFT_3154 [Piloderma croceum F 1598]|uniref:Uncharacterized protein n=1 Tax=Piloderma croceum (strain F 1598) TaxID=765440 RepID=A0A0C3BNR9_PILCF|nr:hypothetical protein PILCRDRAFT_3154 [Piloderma croceum F 1598]
MESISNDFPHLSVVDLLASSGPSTTPALERISMERDVFTDDDHKPLDAKIRLTTITADEAEELLDREPSIVRILRNGWQAGSFKEVRQLAILWPEVQEQFKRSVVPIEQQDDPSLRVQSLVFVDSRIHRRCLRGVVESYKKYYRSNEHVYANYLAIVQSSGMGKSRTVDEMGKHHFLIPMNLREAESTGRLIALTVHLRPDDALGYPPADHDVRNYLCAEQSDSSVVYQRACAFLAALFDETASVLRGDPDAVAKPEELPPIDLDEDVASLAAQFRTYMNAGTTMTAHGRFQTEFYAKVVDRAQKVALPLCEAFINRCSASNTEVPSVSVSPSYPDADEFPPITSFKLENVIRNSPHDSPTPSENLSQNYGQRNNQERRLLATMNRWWLWRLMRHTQ